MSDKRILAEMYLDWRGRYCSVFPRIRYNTEEELNRLREIDSRVHNSFEFYKVRNEYE